MTAPTTPRCSHGDAFDKDDCAICNGTGCAESKPEGFPPPSEWTCGPSTEPSTPRCYCGNYHCAGDCGPEDDPAATDEVKL